MGYKLKRIMMRPNGVEKQVRPTETVLFDFGDWTNSQWTETSSGSQGTITKTANYITFYNSSNYSNNYLSQYQIDGTKDFLLEFNANIPNTSQAYHTVNLINSNFDAWLGFDTNRENSNKMNCIVGSQRYYSETNPGTADYFIKKEGSVLTMGRNNTVKYTDSNYSFESVYYLYEQVYRNTLTINTAKLTYL